MALIYCPECGHEVSANAIACPNCGRPLGAVPEPVDETVVRTAPVVRRREVLPPWAIVAMGVLGVALLLTIIFLLKSSSEDSNVNVAVNANRRAANLETARETRTTVPPTESAPVSIPPSEPSTSTSIPSTSTSIPSTSAPVSMPPPTTTSAPIPDKGTVVIRAQLATPRGTTQPAKGVKFYLLDKDIETILSNARVEPIEGNTLSGSIGLAAVFPDRYGEFQRAVMRAIGPHVKYSGSTDGGGTANLNGIKPSEYYLFSITRVGKGFAMWDSPVSVVPGQNMLDLSPQTINEIGDTSGED